MSAPSINAIDKVGTFSESNPERLRKIAMEIAMDRPFGELKEEAMRVLMDAARQIEEERRYACHLADENRKLRSSIRKMREKTNTEGAHE